MKQINYNHLYYFYVVAREGGIARAAQKLHVTAQTISGQITIMEDYLGVQLFNREGKRLVLNEMGQIAFSYCEDIFSLGRELSSVLSTHKQGQSISLMVGVIDVVPKVFAFDLLKQCFSMDHQVRLISREGDLEFLLSEMAMTRLDLIISDRPLPPHGTVKAYSHFLGESGLTFFAAKTLADRLTGEFPQLLDGAPFLFSGDRSVQKHNVLSWFEHTDINPHVVAEFDDTALLKLFGQDGLGVFCVPTGIESFVLQHYQVQVLGRTTEIKERYYAISPERKIKHQVVEKLVAEAKRVMGESR